MDLFDKYLDKAIHFLTFRARSEKEVRENLMKKKIPADVLEKVIAYLKEQRFLDDEAFAKQWITSRTTYKPRSKRVIKLELLQKGIGPDLIEKVLEEGEVVVSDLDQARKLAASRLGRYKNLSREETFQKLAGYLARRGFNWDVIRQSVDDVLKEEYNNK